MSVRVIQVETAADATRFPHLYRGTYWGNFRLDANADMIGPEIIRNRDAFAKRWELRRRIEAVGRYPATGRGEDFDHAETFKDAEGWVVLVVSNYGSIPPPAVLGMERIAPLYGRGVGSWAGRFASVRELRARLEACGDGAGRRQDAARAHGGGAAGAIVGAGTNGWFPRRGVGLPRVGAHRAFPRENVFEIRGKKSAPLPPP